MNHELVRFYEGRGSDHRGRYLTDIIAWDDDKWETCHDHIQWVFPLREASKFNPHAPLLDDSTIELFKIDATIQASILDAVARVERFLGAYEIDPAPGWLEPGDHNLLRVTRILKFLKLVGRDEKAHELYEWLTTLSDRYPHQVPPKTMAFWSDAAEEV